MVEITEQQLQKKLQEGKFPIMIEFFASWCGPCQTLAPIVAQLAKEYQGKAGIFKIDIEKNPNVVTLFSIMSIPTILFFKGTKVVDQIVGAVEKEEIVKRLEKLFE